MKQAGALFVVASALALSGCVAAVVPMAAASAIARNRGVSRKDRTPAPPPSLRVPVFAPGTTGQSSVAGNAALETSRPAVSTTPRPMPTHPPAAAVAPPPRASAPIAAAIPPPQHMPAAAPITPIKSDFAAFTAYTLRHAADAPSETRLSQLVDPGTLTDKPQRLGCATKPPAVAIDLDPGGKTFDPADPPSPAPGLAEALAQLRGAGVVVFWKSALSVDQADKVYTVLRAVGLDPDRTDRLILTRQRDERKETRLVAASRDWCFIALAGDRKSDFLEALDYLRDPEGPIAQAVQPLYGAGWFLTPTPID